MTDPPANHDEVLGRAREVARRIAERVRKATGDTAPDVALGPTDDTAARPPLPESPPPDDQP